MKTTMSSLFAVFLLAAATGDVDGRVITTTHSSVGQSCIQRLNLCFVNFRTALDAEDWMNNAAEGGMEAICPPFMAVKDCFVDVLGSCDESENPFHQMINVIVDTISFVCVQEVRAINADRECLFGTDLYTALTTQCEDYGLGHVCSLVSDNACAFTLIETQCSNPSLANKFRAFAGRLQRGAGCRG